MRRGRARGQRGGQGSRDAVATRGRTEAASRPAAGRNAAPFKEERGAWRARRLGPYVLARVAGTSGGGVQRSISLHIVKQSESASFQTILPFPSLHVHPANPVPARLRQLRAA